MALWLRESGQPTHLVNILPTFTDLIRALSSWLGTTLAGCLSLRLIWTGQSSLVLFAIICLAIWEIPNGLKFVAFYFGGFSGMASPILYSWVNTTLKENYGERGLVISSMMTFGFCAQIWVPLFTFPNIEAPRFPHGYPAAAVFEVTMWGFLMFGSWAIPRWKAKRADLEAVASQGSEGDADSEVVDVDGKRADKTVVTRVDETL